MAKNKFTQDELLQLCEEVSPNMYSSKSGAAYFQALKELLNADSNKNDNPFSEEDIAAQPLLKDFTFEGVSDFKKVCKLVAHPMTINKNVIKKDKFERKNEFIEAYDFVDEEAKELFYSKKGVVYIFTCEDELGEHIIKIGQTRNSFNDRLQSYNCGYVYNWRTASTTNIKILQSFLTTRKVFNLYLCDCSCDPIVYNWHGVTSISFASPQSLAYEDIMIKEFIKQFNTKPLANVQANATTVKNIND